MTATPGLGARDIAANQDILDYLRSFAAPSVKERGMDYGGWELHTHPDLVDAFARIVGSSKELVPVLGVPVVVHHDVIIAIALGTSWLMFPASRVPHRRGTEQADPATCRHQLARG